MADRRGPVVPRALVEAMRGRKMTIWERIRHWWAAKTWWRWSISHQLDAWEREAHRLMGLNPDKPERGVRYVLRGYVQALHDEAEERREMRRAIVEHREAVLFTPGLDVRFDDRRLWDAAGLTDRDTV